MPQDLELDIRERLGQYVQDETSLEEFESWFVPSSWNVHQAEDRGLQDLVYEIELRLSEFSSGHWTEQELKHLLSRIRERYVVEIGPVMRYGANNETITYQPPVWARTQVEEVPA